MNRFGHTRAFCLLAMQLCCGSLSGAPGNPQIVLSEETTVITRPLASDGLPDYEAYLLEQRSKGLTKSNNAAVFLAKALWPLELESEDQRAVLKSLGIVKPPQAKDGLREILDEAMVARIADWLGVDKGDYATIVSVTERAKHMPWTADQAPPIAAWVQANSRPMDLIVEASRLPRCFAPAPTLLDDKRDDLLDVSLFSIHQWRRSIDALGIRAMLRLGEHNHRAAFRDTFACYRLARLWRDSCTPQETMLDCLLAAGLTSLNHARTVAILHHGDASTAELEGCLGALQRMPPILLTGDVFRQGERMFFINSVMQFATEEGGFLRDEYARRGVELHKDLDWNLIISENNEVHDRLAAIIEVEDRGERVSMYKKLKAEVQERLAQTRTVKQDHLQGEGMKQSSQESAALLAAEMIEGSELVLDINERNKTLRDLAITAAALAVYRSQHGAYPERLAQLAPAILSATPVDLYAGKPYLYQPRNDGGYLLYSVSQNSVDNGGDQADGRIVNGEWINEPEPVYTEEDDLVIRVPFPSIHKIVK